MNKEELKSYIVSKIYEIEKFEPSDKNEVCEILADVWNKYFKIELDESESKLKKDLFERSKPITKNLILNDIEQLKIGNESFTIGNYIQIKLTLKSVLASLG